MPRINDFDVVTGLLSAAVATSGTFTTGYPAGSRLGDFRSGVGHRLVVGGRQYVCPTDFTLAYTSATVITVTWAATNTLPAGSTFRLQLARGNSPTYIAETTGPDNINNASWVFPVRINLGAPIAPAATGVTTAQLLGAAGNLTIDGTRASGGVATLDAPRNFTLTVATTNQSGINFTVYGTDEYGAALVEVLAGPNNNTVQGKKAFKTITRVAASAAVATNGVSVGFGDVLGLPVHVTATAILKELQDGAAASAGTLVAGLSPLTKSTGSTADVRGTYDPSAACDGAKVFELDVLVVDPTFRGNPQFTA